METKKERTVDLERKRNLHLTIGLLLSVSLVTFAFEWRTALRPMVDIPEGEVIEHILPPVPITVQEPPKPKIAEIRIVPVEDDKVIVDDITFDLPSFDDPVDEPVFIEPPKETSEEIHLIVEEQPSFPGGEQGFYTYVSKHLDYPKQAIRHGVEGKVYVQFVVDTDGSLSDIQVLKGIGAGCDAEALRVLQNSPPWNPGKQRGRAVRVRMTIPIIFRLQ